MRFLRILRQKRSARALLAAGFLFALLAEWGSHAVICSGETITDAAEQQSMTATDPGHEDPCQTLILCSDGRQDQQTRHFMHDASQHNGLVDVFASLCPHLKALRERKISFGDAARIFRPPKPPFHPPKQA